MSTVEVTGELFRSGAPIWSFRSFRTVFAVASGAAIAGWREDDRAVDARRQET